MNTSRLAIAKTEKVTVQEHRAVTVHAEDPLWWFGALLTKARTIWMSMTYPFARFGDGVSIHYTCDIRRSAASRIQIGDSVYIAPQTWLNIPEPSADAPATLILGNGCKIGRRCMFSAKNLVRLEENVLLGPSVLITDHSHQFSDPDMPIHAQGLTAGGTVRIERNCWLGYGAVIVCNTGELVVGRNSVVGANTVVTGSVPPFSVVAGNPARIIKRYDPALEEWLKEGAVLGRGLAEDQKLVPPSI
jgi:acetyltransferase-like isoleucine patch superfamily enzyme